MKCAGKKRREIEKDCLPIAFAKLPTTGSVA